MTTNLYAVLNVTSSVTVQEIKSAYRKLALSCHPDKLPTTLSSSEHSAKVQEFQQIGIAYSILSDSTKRKRYDETGCIDDSGWENADAEELKRFFTELYQKLDDSMIQEFASGYRGITALKYNSRLCRRGE